MAMKEHPFVVTTTFDGDGVTIQYDKSKKNRSDAVGKAFRIRADGKAELVPDGEEIDGKVIGGMNDKHQFTGAYMSGGLLFPLGDGATVARGNKLVGAANAAGDGGYVKAAPEIARAADGANAAAVLTAVQNVADNAKGKGNVLESDSTHALASFPA